MIKQSGVASLEKGQLNMAQRENFEAERNSQSEFIYSSCLFSFRRNQAFLAILFS